MSSGVGRRRGSDPMLLWIWRRPAATAPIRPLAWEIPYAMGAALEKAKRQERKEGKERKERKKNGKLLEERKKERKERKTENFPNL